MVMILPMSIVIFLIAILTVTEGEAIGYLIGHCGRRINLRDSYPLSRSGKAPSNVRENHSPMPTCADCFLYTKKNEKEGECTINGPAPADREAERCPSRTFRPKA